MKVQSLSFGPLTALAKKRASSLAIVFLHGHGANSGDVVPLADSLPVYAKYDWFFPEAPHVLNDIPGGRTWFDLFSDASRPEGLDESLKAVTEGVSNLRESYTHLVLGGFSQGSMLSLELGFTTLRDIQALGLFSTTLWDESSWRERLADPPPLSIFQGHGTGDGTLPLAKARRLRELIQESSLSFDYYEFDGGHEIPLSLLRHFAHFLEKIS